MAENDDFDNGLSTVPAPAHVLEHAGEAIVTLDNRETIRSWNRAAEALFGYAAPEIVGRPFAVLVPAERLAAGELGYLRRRVRARGVVQGFETEGMTKTGRRVQVSITRSELVDASGRSVGQCCVIRDVGSERAIVHQLYESEKFAALRAMAVGVAHEIGNPLAGVLGLMQLVERRTGEAETRERLLQARRELSRVGKIIRELTDYTRADGETTTTDVNEVVVAALGLAKYAHESAPVRVHLELDSSVRPLLGTRHHLLQAFLHLVMNAYDAMGAEGGCLTVHSHQENHSIVVRFEDSGSGMASEVSARIFEPFFTTKPEGSGTGLGLFVCQRIVAAEFGGRIEVETARGAGSRFTVTLPLESRAAVEGRNERRHHPHDGTRRLAVAS